MTNLSLEHLQAEFCVLTDGMNCMFAKAHQSGLRVGISVHGYPGSNVGTSGDFKTDGYETADVGHATHIEVTVGGRTCANAVGVDHE